MERAAAVKSPELPHPSKGRHGGKAQLLPHSLLISAAAFHSSLRDRAAGGCCCHLSLKGAARDQDFSLSDSSKHFQQALCLLPLASLCLGDWEGGWRWLWRWFP